MNKTPKKPKDVPPKTTQRPKKVALTDADLARASGGHVVPKDNPDRNKKS